MPLPIQPLSPLDGRYQRQTSGLAEHLSEAGLNRARVHVEVEWLLWVAANGLFGASPVDDGDADALRQWAAGFGQEQIDWLAEKEAVTRHDVKAVEYLVRDRLEQQGLSRLAEAVHI